MKITQLFQYPLKSCRAREVRTLEIIETGVLYDRVVAALDRNRDVLTARTHPMLLQVGAEVRKNQLILTYPGMESLKVPLNPLVDDKLPFRLFSNEVEGHVLNDSAAMWISEVARTDAKLVVLSDFQRPMLSRHNALAGDVVGLADASPIHLISKASLDDLNSRIDAEIPIHQFRPNIVVKGCAPYAEDGWKQVRIGDCLFDVHMACPRCTLSTINPGSGDTHATGEPLRTLNTYRKDAKDKVNFGVYMIPRKLGTVKVGMRVELV